MRRKISVISLVLCMSFIFTLISCTGDGESTTSATIDTVTESVTESATDTDSQNTEELTTDLTTEVTSGESSEITADETEETDETVDEIANEIDTFTPEAEVKRSTGCYKVKTADGLEYTAENYSHYLKSGFVIGDDFTITLTDDLIDREFNRLTLCYTSSHPLKCTVRYVQNGRVIDDVIYLEKGERISSSLIRGYIDGKSATSVERLTFDVLGGELASFMLYRIHGGSREVYTNDTYYLQNERYKLGIRLIWGGGISYIEDKQSPVSGLTNLVNNYDTGRLIQQSYYGTYANGEYVNGSFNGREWRYNPVQGGDVYQNKSRLIDIKVSNNSVYIKAQPQDWGHNGKITPSYMENTYTVYSDRIEVDNRFVDFSGWEHPYAGQELPAFYTVSYFNRFSYYNGIDPWEDGELIHRDGLPFCDGPDAPECSYRFMESNTETWCAWTNKFSNYGIGLYTPGADRLLAGRYLDGNSKNPSDNSCSYVSTVELLQINSFRAIEYSYMIATGSVEEIRETFKMHKDFAENESLDTFSKNIKLPDTRVSWSNIEFSVALHTDYVEAKNSTEIKFNGDRDAIMITCTGGDPQINIPYSNSERPLAAENFGKIIIEYMIPTGNAEGSYTGQLFLCTGDNTHAKEEFSVRYEYIADGQFHTVAIPVSSFDFWSGQINSIRFDYFNSAEKGDVIYVRNISLIP